MRDISFMIISNGNYGSSLLNDNLICRNKHLCPNVKFSPSYEAIYIRSAYPGSQSRDIDPDTKDSLLGITGILYTQEYLIYIETIRHVYNSGNNQTQSWVVAHEIGHLFVGLDHLEDGNLMDEGADVRNPVFSEIHINVIRAKDHP